MNDTPLDPHAELRRAVYWLLIIVSAGVMIGRIWTVTSQLGETPLLSANDRSRWCTIRSLVDHGTYAIDDVIFKDGDRRRRDREWYPIDMVRHRGPDGLEHYYSSKPPLLLTMLAWEYYAVKVLTGATLAEKPFYVVRLMLIISNVLPLLAYFWLMSRMIERYGQTTWGRLFIFTATAFGTFLTTFAVTLNNHIPAAFSVAVGMYAMLAVWRERRLHWGYFALAGVFSAFAVANELPALSFFAMIGGALMLRSPLRTLVAFLPGAALVAAAFFHTNYAAHGCYKPPYAHRSDGAVVATVADADSLMAEIQAGVVPESVRQSLESAGVSISPRGLTLPRWSGEGWMLWDFDGQDRLAIREADGVLEFRQWDNWYEYERSYWYGKKTGVDLGEPSRGLYAFHITLGHHGVFSLTPVWLMSLLGLVYWSIRRDARMRGFALMVVTLTAVCLAFYIARPLKDRNYAGVCCGFRWMFWFIPMWLLAAQPVADWISSRRIWRWIGLVLLLAAVASAGYASLNPWAHPWLYQYWVYLGWTTPY